MVDYVTQKKSLIEAVELAYGEFEALAGEMRDAFDNTPENLQGSGVGAAREQAADDLEQLDEPTVPKLLEDMIVSWQERSMSAKQLSRMTRAERRDAGINILESIISDLDKKLEEVDEIDDTVDGKQEQIEEIKSFRDDIENLIDNAAAIEFPGRDG